MNQNKRKLMPASELGIYCLMLIFLSFDVVIAESFIDFGDELILPDNELDLSIDLNKLDDKTTRPNFTGVWVLNHSASDDPKEVLNKIKKGKNDPPGGGKGSGRGPGGMGRGKPENGRPGGMAHSIDESLPIGNNNGPKLLEKLLINELVIQHNEPLFRVNMERIYTDLRGSSVSVLGGADQSVSFAGWEGNSLVIETTQDDTQKTNERFTLLTSPKRLERTTEIQLSGQKNNTVQIKQIYELKKQTIKSYNNSSFSFHF